ncbi:MAG: hypothetical protein JRN19_06625 [Nitrososphaerota archaeon]|nr:hypothetical protein [Nitrososphaerota archaeon]MDG7052106.1 hypothetical protein [Nitrososphaerota archaeon]
MKRVKIINRIDFFASFAPNFLFIIFRNGKIKNIGYKYVAAAAATNIEESPGLDFKKNTKERVSNIKVIIKGLPNTGTKNIINGKTRKMMPGVKENLLPGIKLEIILLKPYAVMPADIINGNLIENSCTSTLSNPAK